MLKVLLFTITLSLYLTVAGLTQQWLLASTLLLLVAIISQLPDIKKLIIWWRYSRDSYPPEFSGVFASLYNKLAVLLSTDGKKKHDLNALVRRFQLGAESLPDAVVVFNTDKKLVWSNHLATTMLGISWPHDRGIKLDQLITNPDFTSYLDKKDYQQPLELVSPTNAFTILECRIAPFERDKWTLISRDVTQIKNMEQMRKDFIANVSHELKTPLTVINGYLELLDSEQPDPAIWQKAHSVMLKQSHRMTGLVTQLLTLAKIENSQKLDVSDTTDMASLIEEATLQAENLSDGKHRIIITSLSDVAVSGNKEELLSAVSNIIENAVRYTPEGGEITISWQQLNNGDAEFSCIDNGEGIAAEHLQRLTERFYRVDTARARATGGSGLGLAIVKHILARYQSELIIKSQLHKGSCFRFAINKRYLTLTS